MKKLLLTFSLATGLLSARAQMIITGYIANPRSDDGNYEYVQLMATENIDFATTNYSLITAYVTGSAAYPAQGWATGGSLTYKFELTSGTVSAGEFFYVGGIGADGKNRIGGPSSTDISSAKWIRSKPYLTENGDGGIGNARSGMFTNSGNAQGIAIFSGTAVTSSTIPLDVVFFGDLTGNHYQVSPELGYRICDNDLYSTTNGEYFRKGSNTAVFAHGGDYAFSKLGGVYDADTKTWTTPRSLTPIVLTNTSTLSQIETGIGITTLPVSLTSLMAKANKAGTVNLAWTTASEENNSRFDITRSSDGKNFGKIGEVAGNGNSNTIKNYNYTDNSPVVGINYYRLKQIDNDGKSALSQVVSAKVGLSQNNVSVSVGKAAVTVNYKALVTGKATFTVYSMSGAKLASLTQNVSVGANQVSIPVQLGNGLHLLQVQQGTESISVKF